MSVNDIIGKIKGIFGKKPESPEGQQGPQSMPFARPGAPMRPGQGAQPGQFGAPVQPLQPQPTRPAQAYPPSQEEAMVLAPVAQMPPEQVQDPTFSTVDAQMPGTQFPAQGAGQGPGSPISKPGEDQGHPTVQPLQQGPAPFPPFDAEMPERASAEGQNGPSMPARPGAPHSVQADQPAPPQPGAPQPSPTGQQAQRAQFPPLAPQQPFAYAPQQPPNPAQTVQATPAPPQQPMGQASKPGPSIASPPPPKAQVRLTPEEEDYVQQLIPVVKSWKEHGHDRASIHLSFTQKGWDAKLVDAALDRAYGKRK